MLWRVIGVMVVCFSGLSVPTVVPAADPGVAALEKAVESVRATGGRENVHRAVGRLVADQDVEVIGSGSHISGNYTPGSSDHDFSMRLTETMDDQAALAEWRAARSRLSDQIHDQTRQQLEVTLRRELENLGLDGEEIDRAVAGLRSKIERQAADITEDVVSRTKLYPPAQLMQGVEDAEQAIERFKELGLSPDLAHAPGVELSDDQWKAAGEGIWGEGGLPFRQDYEEKAGRIWYQDTVVDANGVKTTTVRSGFTDLTHLSDGYGTYTIEGTSATAKQWSQKARESVTGSSRDYRVAFKDMERAHLDMKKARSLASLPEPNATPMRSF